MSQVLVIHCRCGRQNPVESRGEERLGVSCQCGITYVYDATTGRVTRSIPVCLPDGGAWRYEFTCGSNHGVVLVDTESMEGEDHE